MSGYLLLCSPRKHSCYSILQSTVTLVYSRAGWVHSIVMNSGVDFGSPARGQGLALPPWWEGRPWAQNVSPRPCSLLTLCMQERNRGDIRISFTVLDLQNINVFLNNETCNSSKPLGFLWETCFSLVRSPFSLWLEVTLACASVSSSRKWG